MIQEERLIRLFTDLCLINAPALAERESVAWTKRYLEEIGLEVHEDNAGERIGGNANNLIVWLRGNLPDAPKIFFSAHFDTVEPTAGLVIEEVDGVFSSASDTILGADDKSGMAPAIEALQAIKESGMDHGDVCLLLTVAEEIGLKGAAALDVQDLDLDFGYVLDTGPPVGSYVVRTATHDKIDVRIIGRPAHSGKDPEKGINAMQVAAAAINGMCLGRLHPEMTANLGIIEGGTAVNVVCPFVRIRGEARSTSIPDLDAQIAHMIGRFEDACREWGAQLEVKHDRHYYSYEIPTDSTVVEVGQRASIALGLEPTLRTTLGGSDANIFNARGLPTIVMATGMEQIHTHEENVSRESLILNAKLVVECVREASQLVRPSRS